MPRSDADALMRAVLAAPADPTPRLVFADWLEESGTPANVAWAQYIRLRAELAVAAPGDPLRDLYRQQAKDRGWAVRAQLTVPASRFVPAFQSFLDLLPARCYTLTLAGFTAARPHVRMLNGVVARGINSLVLGVADSHFVVAMADPTDAGSLQFLERSFPGIIVPVRVSPADLEDAFQRHYVWVQNGEQNGAADEPHASSTTLDPFAAPTAGGMIERLCREARTEGATAIEIAAYADHYLVRYVITGRPVRRHQISVTLGAQLVDGAQQYLRLQNPPFTVQTRDTLYGECVRLIFRNTPPPRP